MIYKFGSHEIELYDSTHSLPVKRFQRFNKYQMQATEIGSDFVDYDSRMDKIIHLLDKKMYEEAKIELQNKRQSVYNAYNEFSPESKSFAIMVKRIDRTKYKGYEPDDLDKVLAHLERIGLTKEISLSTLREVKKNSKRNYLYIIPTLFREIFKMKARH